MFILYRILDLLVIIVNNVIIIYAVKLLMYVYTRYNNIGHKGRRRRTYSRCVGSNFENKKH